MRFDTLRRKALIVLSLGVIAGAALEVSYMTQEANAIPALARKYGFSCNVCHVPGFPKLNDFGNIFRDHGYQLGGDQDLPTYDSITMGYWPVSFRTTVGYQAANLRVDGTGASTGSFGFTGLDILSFGLLHRHISFGVVYTPGLGSAGFGANSTAGQGDLESAFVRLNNLERFVGGKSNGYLVNLKVGKFELDVPFSERRSQTLNTPFVMYHYQPGTPYSAVLSNLTASRYNAYSNPNDFAIGENQPGAELAGIAPTPGNGYFRYSLAALSNSNLNTGNVGGGRGTNFYGHVTQSFGGYGVVTGHRVGIFGAYGDAPRSSMRRVRAVPPLPQAASPSTGSEPMSASRSMANGTSSAPSCTATTAKTFLPRRPSPTPKTHPGTAPSSSWIGTRRCSRCFMRRGSSSPTGTTSSGTTVKGIRPSPRTTTTSIPTPGWRAITFTSPAGPILPCMQNTTRFEPRESAPAAVTNWDKPCSPAWISPTDRVARHCRWTRSADV